MSESSRQVACFEVAGGCYAVPIGDLREIVALPPISKLPGSPRLIEGLIDLRGRLVPVVDLARVVGTGREALPEEARVAVVRWSDLLMGLCVDAATEVLTVEGADSKTIQKRDPAGLRGVIDSVIRRDGRAPVMVLSIEGLVAAVEASSMPSISTGEAA